MVVSTTPTGQRRRVVDVLLVDVVVVVRSGHVDAEVTKSQCVDTVLVSSSLRTKSRWIAALAPATTTATPRARTVDAMRDPDEPGRRHHDGQRRDPGGGGVVTGGTAAETEARARRACGTVAAAPERGAHHGLGDRLRRRPSRSAGSPRPAGGGGGSGSAASRAAAPPARPRRTHRPAVAAAERVGQRIRRWGRRGRLGSGGDGGGGLGRGVGVDRPRPRRTDSRVVAPPTRCRPSAAPAATPSRPSTGRPRRSRRPDTSLPSSWCPSVTIDLRASMTFGAHRRVNSGSGPNGLDSVRVGRSFGHGAGSGLEGGLTRE